MKTQKDKELISKLKELITKQDIAISYFRRYSDVPDLLTRFMAEIGITKTEIFALEKEIEEEERDDEINLDDKDYYRMCENCGTKFWTKYSTDTICQSCKSSIKL